MRMTELADAVRPPEAEAPPLAHGIPGEEPPTVLVVDDSDFFRGQIQRLVEAVGCRVLPAEDGQAAWELLDRNASEVDVVATDIEMPRMDGFALLQAVKADKRLEEIPVILVTSRASDEDRERGLRLGADAYIVKTRFDQNELLAGIRRLL